MKIQRYQMQIDGCNIGSWEYLSDLESVIAHLTFGTELIIFDSDDKCGVSAWQRSWNSNGEYVKAYQYNVNTEQWDKLS